MLQLAKGNLIDMAEHGLFDVIVHGCNCLNTMGSGIAAEIRQRYPAAYEADTAHSNNIKLGNWSEADAGTFIIVNAYTQINFSPRGVDHFEYESFELILEKLATQYAGKKFGFPYIGMGLAGGDKDRIIAMLEDFAEKISATGGSVTLVEFG